MTDGLNGTGEYTFGDFTYRPSDNTLRRGDKNLSVTPKALDLLRVLIANPKTLLTKDELMNMLWPDSYVEESNLAVTIRRLRKALADDAHNPLYIETVARQGYRFVAAVEKIKTDEATTELTGNPRRVRYLIPVAVAAGLLIASISLGSLYLRNTSQAAPILSTPFAVQKLSTNGRVASAAISPDGEKVVYTVRNGVRESVWLQELSTKNNVEIMPASDDDYYNFDFSPDGSILYFTRGQRTIDDPADVYSVSIFGGVPKKIVSDTRGGFSISPDGSTVSFVRCRRSEKDYCSLWVADVGGGNERIVASRPRPIRIADNEISPDGKSVVFAAGQSEDGSRDFGLYSVDLATGTEQQVGSEKFFNIKSIEFLPDNSGLLFTASVTSSRDYRVWRMGFGESSTQLTNDSVSYNSISLDQSGARMIATELAYDYKLIKSDLADAGPRQTLASPAGTFAFDPNGDIIFQSDSTGDGEIWRLGPEGSQTQLTTAQGYDYFPIVNSKTRDILFSSNRSGSMHVWRMKPDGSDQAQVTSANGGMPMFVDGTWVYYQHSKDRTLWRIPVEGGNEEQVLNRPPYRGRFAFAPDGTRAAFVDSNSKKSFLVIISIPGGRELERFDLVDGKGRFEIAWLPDSRSVAYTLSNLERETNTLWIQSLDGSPLQKAADLGDEEVSFLEFPNEPGSVAFIQGSWRHDAVMLTGLQ